MKPEPPATVLERLRAAFPDSSGRRLRDWLAAGRIQVSGRLVRDPRTPVGPEERVTLGSPPPPALAAPLRLVHEDDLLLVIEKPAGLLTIATERERARTASRLVRDYLAGAHPRRRAFVVHRLDRETSGLLVLAKTAAAKERLQAQFAARAAEREYVAVVEGVVRADEGTLRDVLVEDAGLRVRPVAHRGGAPGRAGGRAAITHFRVLERRRDVTRLLLRLGTGRRHQIRVQLAALGHPIVGDREHGASTDPLRRLCLHATRLGFRHPATGARVEFESLPPAAFVRVGVGPPRPLNLAPLPRVADPGEP
jgi:23S rRNA pseudouridine1911/1915/1917 synthase